MNERYSFLEFHQFGADDKSDRLLLFAAKAKDLAQWAGIPKKGWRIRMLFQRWITQGREKELKSFWQRASSPNVDEGESYILSPTAIVVAIQGEPKIEGNQIVLDYTSPIEGVTDPAKRLEILANSTFDRICARLSTTAMEAVNSFQNDPLRLLPDVGHDYVLEFAIQLAQMKADATWFIETNAVEGDELADLIISMEALVRPALVVDGQHRLWGAQAVEEDVMLPVVALAETDWPQQIYQFVVINEKAQKVDSELLNDIFASSLTPSEQRDMRKQFQDVNVDIEQRIAGVLAGREPESPFSGMVTLNLPNPPESEAHAYISQAIIQNLIDGGRGSKGWRSDDVFYNSCIKPNFPNRTDWEDWRTGKWREYWFAFWDEVRTRFRKEARKIKGSDFDIWSPSDQSNLTKGVGLKLFQRFFIETMIAEMHGPEEGRAILVDNLGQEKAAEAIAEKLKEIGMPVDVEVFRERVQTFLEKFPVRFFTANWVASLDDSTGQESLLDQMGQAYRRDNWRASGGGVFVAGE